MLQFTVLTGKFWKASIFLMLEPLKQIPLSKTSSRKLVSVARITISTV